MNSTKKIALLRRLLDQSADVTVPSSSDPKFKTWKNMVERTLIRIFGPESPEFNQFDKLRFFYSPMFSHIGADHSRQHRECFDRDWEILISSIGSYIEEIDDDADEIGTGVGEIETGISKVFVSHSSQDAAFVEELVDLLEVVGLPGEKIFCTSFPGYGVDLGENFLDAIRDELNDQVLVLFVLTQNFYASPICLCEMGAVWALTRDHIPIVVPPFDFADVEGVVPLTEGLKINDPLKLNLLREKIEAAFSLQTTLGQSAWERKRDRIVARIDEKIAELP